MTHGCARREQQLDFKRKHPSLTEKKLKNARKKQPSGLITPVVKDVSNKSMLKISAEAKDMAARLPPPSLNLNLHLN
jgi:hypothetical protein